MLEAPCRPVSLRTPAYATKNDGESGRSRALREDGSAHGAPDQTSEGFAEVGVRHDVPGGKLRTVVGQNAGTPPTFQEDPPGGAPKPDLASGAPDALHQEVGKPLMAARRPVGAGPEIAHHQGDHPGRGHADRGRAEKRAAIGQDGG